MDDTPTQQEQEDLDQSLRDTFPASDPPAHSGTTGPTPIEKTVSRSSRRWSAKARLGGSPPVPG